MPYLKRFLTPRGGGVTSSLLVFKIKVKDSGVDLRADTISIEIDLKNTPYILGVKRQLSVTDPAWTRTDDSVNLVANANQCDSVADFNNKGIAKDDFAMSAHGGSLYFYKDIDIVNMAVLDNASKGIKQGDILDRLSTNPNNFNWGATKDGEAVNIMTYYPGHYIKREQKDGWEYIQLSMLDFDGAMYVEPYYRGTFEAIYTGSKLRSYAGGDVKVSTTIGTFRTYAKSSGMSLGDWRDFDFLCLYLIKYAHYNSQTQVGRGIVDLGSSGSRQNTGSGGAHNTLKGRDGYIGSGTTATVWCLGLCNPWGNVYEFVDGITISSYYAYVSTDPANYGDGRTEAKYGYTKLAYKNLTSSDVWVSKVGCDYNAENPTNQLLAFPTETGGDTNKGICDKYWSTDRLCVVFRGGYYNDTAAAGAFSFRCYAVFSSFHNNVGCRLLKTA